MDNLAMIIVRCKQPIKIKQPLQRLLPFSYSVGEILQIVFLSFFFSVFIFSMPSKLKIIET